MTWWQILLIILAVILVLLVVLYFVGSKMQRKQAVSQEQMDAMKQTLSMLIIDKKKMKLKDANLPDMVLQQTPKYMRRMKMNHTSCSQVTAVTLHADTLLALAGKY